MRIKLFQLRRRLRKDQRGQAIVELALILPVFLLMVLGMIDLARAWNAKQVITDAAREAARRGVVDNPIVTQTYVEGVAESALSNAGFDYNLATITATGVNAPTGDPLQVDITYPYTFEFMSIFMNMIGGNTVTLTTSIVMRNE